MVNIAIAIGCIVALGIFGIFVMQSLNRQELLTQRDDIEMMRFRLKTINSELEEILGIIKTTQTSEDNKTDEITEENAHETIRPEKAGVIKEGDFEFHNETDDYGFRTQPAPVAPKRDERIEYEEENFIIEEDD